ncbi:MAG: sugar phosphate isomerase/epimerase, partial [Blautia sp.]|nr:sugar phosphate isomerase/epimerase [Blautia sp.]
EGIPADKIVSIQINDVWERPYATTILRDESMHDRLAPGTGIGTTVPFVKMIKEKGIRPNAIGVEVISDANLEKGIGYAAKHTYENTKKVLEEAWPEVL